MAVKGCADIMSDSGSEETWQKVNITEPECCCWLLHGSAVHVLQISQTWSNSFYTLVTPPFSHSCTSLKLNGQRNMDAWTSCPVSRSDTKVIKPYFHLISDHDGPYNLRHFKSHRGWLAKWIKPAQQTKRTSAGYGLIKT